MAEQLLEGGAEGEFYGEVKDYFLYSQLRAQGEDSTADRLAGIDKPVPTSEIPRLLRALGHYPSERELSDIFRELAVETSGDGDMAADPPATIGFDRFVSLYVNYRPMFGVDAGSIESAFAARGAGPRTDAAAPLTPPPSGARRACGGRPPRRPPRRRR